MRTPLRLTAARRHLRPWGLGLVLFLQLTSMSSQAASRERPGGHPPLIARISFVIPKLVVEMAPVDQFCFSTAVMIRPTWWEEAPNGKEVYRPVPLLNPRIYLEPRFFINTPHRMRRGKRIDYYSGWFVGLPFSVGFPEKHFYMANTMGWQCTFGRRWYWNWETGPGFAHQEHFKFHWYVDASFGIILN